MKIYFFKYIKHCLSGSLLTALLSAAYAQNTEPLPPPAEIAEKIESPVVSDTIKASRTPINYHFYEFPYTSGFDLDKGNYIQIHNTPSSEKPHNNYVGVGYGSFSSPFLKAYITNKLFHKHSLSLKFSHTSSANSIPTAYTPLNNGFSGTQALLRSDFNTKKHHMAVSFSIDRQMLNWYGLPINYANFSEPQISAIEEKHTYVKPVFHFEINPKANKEIRHIAVDMRMFFDRLGVVENNVVFNAQSVFNIDNQEVFMDYDLDNLTVTTPYRAVSNTLLARISPFFKISNAHVSVKAGVNFFFNSQSADKTQTFSVFPSLDFSYKLLSKYLIAYGGANGHQSQNTYAKFTDYNPFISPDLQLIPTIQTLKLHAGMKGKILANLSYDLSASVAFEKNLPLYKLSTIENDDTSFRNGNSFQVVYDDVNTFKGSARLVWEIDKKLQSSWILSVFSYGMTKEDRAWNLPSVKSDFFINWQINRWLFSSTNWFIMGSRFDLLSDMRSGTLETSPFKLDPYVDANFELEAKILKNLGMFLKINNLIGENYQSIGSYRVQGRQFIAGLSFVF